jgi:beta-lactamase class A
VRDTGGGWRASWRPDHRFPMCSTFKFLLVGAVLARVDRGQEQLARKVRVSKADLLQTSPYTEQHVGFSATVGGLCEAAIIFSDNAAANLLLATIGGPSGLTAFARSLGDRYTRLDRNEPALGQAEPGDPRDTTLPQAMLGNLDRLLLGSVLKPASRTLLTGWMIDNRTGGKRLRAGLPKSWRVGDKTGSGANGTTNDIAVIWPERNTPVLIASYLTGSTLEPAARDALHARVAEALVRALRQQG